VAVSPAFDKVRLASLLVSSMSMACVHSGSIDTSEAPVAISREDESQCTRATMGKFGPYRMPLADPVTDPESVRYLEDFPPEARRTARAAGLEQLLADILREKQATGDQPSMRLLSMEEELSLRLEAFEIQLLASTFEIHCTAVQVQDVINDLDKQERHRQFSLAVTSLVAAGLGATAAGVWTLGDPQNTRGPAAVSIGAGLTVGGLGIAALGHPDYNVRLIHEHNLLEPVWRGIDPKHLYPSFVFRMLMMANPDGEGSPRSELMKKWIADLQEVAGPSHNIADVTMYGSGGEYSRDLLDVRHDQLEGLVSALQSIGRDLELFTRYLVGRITPPAASVPKTTPLTPPPPAPSPITPAP
jgi:hypothetical protein